MVGATILSEERTAVPGINRWNFTLSEFQKGIYMIHVKSSAAILTQNFIVDK